jgi:DNA primase
VKLLSPKQKAFFEQAATSYQQQLHGDTVAQTYLASRGIGPEAASTFRLGVVRQPLVGHESYGGRLCIPYITPGGVVNFSFRCLTQGCMRCKDSENGHPKYMATSLDRTLYNVLALDTESQAIHVCEGELDALTLTLAGLPAVGVPGVSNWKPWYNICFADFAEVYVWADADEAGRKFGKFVEKELRARRVALPQGEDVNGWYRRVGAEGLRGLLGDLG